MTTFEAHGHHGTTASIGGWAICLGAVLAGALFLVLGLTGVIPLFDGWFWPAFIALGVLAMVFVVPRELTKTAALYTAHPLLELDEGGLLYAGSRFPAHATTGVLRADLGPQEESSRYKRGDAFYVHFDPSHLDASRRDGLIDTRRRRLVIQPGDFADPVPMSRALVTHLETLGVRYVDCGSSQGDLTRAEKDLT
ncbi:hypothetical protein [Janibacter anophelis]|uniref:hypothetical protein n=1 Tax=Janibacter anophelis TaxID=319054 RepID=UPI0013B064C2|nr:hypothetical protein [Janibacter anophelis]